MDFLARDRKWTVTGSKANYTAEFIQTLTCAEISPLTDSAPINDTCPVLDKQ